MWHAVFPTTFGSAAIIWHDAGVVGFMLPAPAADSIEAAVAERWRPQPAPEIPGWIAAVIERVRHHFAGTPQDFADVRLDWSRVGEFQRAVYTHAQAIKPGRTSSYGDIARAMGLPPASARAVGVALGNNPWPLLVPCHRVVASNGKMTGFSAPGGIRTKTRLLALEGAELILE